MFADFGRKSLFVLYVSLYLVKRTILPVRETCPSGYMYINYRLEAIFTGNVLKIFLSNGVRRHY